MTKIDFCNRFRKLNSSIENDLKILQASQEKLPPKMYCYENIFSLHYLSFFSSNWFLLFLFLFFWDFAVIVIVGTAV